MVDRRLGRDASGPQAPQSVRRRPEFRVGEGHEALDVAADTALDAARASGRVRGDLRGEPAKNSSDPSYVNQQRRRRPPVGAQPEAQETRAHTEREDETAHNARANRRSERDQRQYNDREFSEDRELTDEERIAMLRAGYFQVVLPDLPKVPGRHRVWLTTTNPRDTIAGRRRMGYRLLSLEDLGPGWEQQKAISGEYSGCIMINEMIAAEISERLYQVFMHELHHRMPREAERGIFGRLDEQAEDMARRGSKLLYEESGRGLANDEENAFEHLKSTNPRPKQFET